MQPTGQEFFVLGRVRMRMGFLEARSPRGAPATATWQRAPDCGTVITDLDGEPVNLVARSKPRSTAGSVAIALRPCGR